MTRGGLRAVDAVGIVVAETTAFYQQVFTHMTAIVGYPCPTLEMLRPAVADNRLFAPIAHEGFAHLVARVFHVVTAVVDGVQIQPFHQQVVSARLNTSMCVGGGVIRRGSKVNLRVPHPRAYQPRAIGTVKVDTLLRLPSPLGNIDGRPLVGSDEIRYITFSMEHHGFGRSHHAWCRHRFQLHEVYRVVELLRSRP